MAGDSLIKFKKDNTVQDNNPTRPNQTPVPGGRQDAVLIGNVLGNAPKIDWSGYSSSDPILNSLGNYNNSSSSSSGKNTGAIIGGIFSGLTAAVAIASPFLAKSSNAQSSSMFTRKEEKQISKNMENTEDVRSALDSTIALANSLDENTNPDKLMKVSENLRTNIKTANSQKSSAIQKAANADANLKNLNETKGNLDLELSSFETGKAAATSQLSILKGIDKSELTDKQKNDIKELESKLNNEFSDKMLKQIQDKIDANGRAIAVQTEIKTNNESIAKSLDQQVKDAGQLADKFDKMINSSNQNRSSGAIEV